MKACPENGTSHRKKPFRKNIGAKTGSKKIRKISVSVIDGSGRFSLKKPDFQAVNKGVAQTQHRKPESDAKTGTESGGIRNALRLSINLRIALELGNANAELPGASARVWETEGITFPGEPINSV